jgi:hypothetical protein
MKIKTTIENGGGFRAMFLRILKGTVLGILAHQANPVIEDWEERIPPAWTRNARYVVGTMAMLPICRSMFRHLYRPGMDEDEAVDVFDAAFIAGAVSFGIGVSVGYVIDGFFRVVWRS